MKIRRATLLLSTLASAFISVGAMAQETQPAKGPVKNIVLVHGAFVGGSGWRPVYDILTKDGYNVTLVQEPLTSLDRKSTRLNSSHQIISYAVFCLKKKKTTRIRQQIDRSPSP